MFKTLFYLIIVFSDGHVEAVPTMNEEKCLKLKENIQLSLIRSKINPSYLVMTCVEI